MRKTNNPFIHRPTRLGHQDRANTRHHSADFGKIFSASTKSRKTTSKRGGSARGSYNYGSSYNSSSSNSSDNAGCGIVMGIFFLVISIGLMLWSFDWDWVSYTRKMHQRVDWSWLKFIFYPGTALGIIFGACCIRTSLPSDDK